LNLNLDHFQSNIEDSENDQIYAYFTILVKMSTNFRSKIQKKYQNENRWKKLTKMLKSLNERREKNTHEEFDVDFLLKNELLFHKNKRRFCISLNCEIDVFKLAHDQNNHAEHNKTYTRLIDTVYISRLSRKLRQYIKHCSACELNQTKRHATYDELILIAFSKISFRTLTMNFIMTLSEKQNTALFVICKTFKRMTIIFDKFIWSSTKWVETLFDRLLVANWDISENIISNRDSKFLFEFWRILF
jgi:hypothetical protein